MHWYELTIFHPPHGNSAILIVRNALFIPLGNETNYKTDRFGQSSYSLTSKQPFEE